MNTQDLIQKLEARGITLSLCGKNLRYTAAGAIPSGIVTTIEAHRRELTKHLRAQTEKPTRVDAEPAEPPSPWSAKEQGPPDTLPRLPWQLERLVSAASSDNLDATMPGVHDLNRYTMAWAAAYLTGDRDEALARLWAVHRAWQGLN